MIAPAGAHDPSAARRGSGFGGRVLVHERQQPYALHHFAKAGVATDGIEQRIDQDATCAQVLDLERLVQQLECKVGISPLGRDLRLLVRGIRAVEADQLVECRVGLLPASKRMQRQRPAGPAHPIEGSSSNSASAPAGSPCTYRQTPKL